MKLSESWLALSAAHQFVIEVTPCWGTMVGDAPADDLLHHPIVQCRGGAPEVHASAHRPQLHINSEA